MFGANLRISFTILSPGTLHGAYLCTAVCLHCIWSIVQYSKQLKKKNLVLERKVEHRTEQLNKSIEDLKATQSQLIHSEMASLGELTAGLL
jgi:hypothetical protein